MFCAAARCSASSWSTSPVRDAGGRLPESHALGTMTPHGLGSVARMPRLGGETSSSPCSRCCSARGSCCSSPGRGEGRARRAPSLPADVLVAPVRCAHAYLLWSGDILFTYAICGMLVYPLRRLPPRKLFLTGSSCSASARRSACSSTGPFPTGRARTLAEVNGEYWQPARDQIAAESHERGGRLRMP